MFMKTEPLTSIVQLEWMISIFIRVHNTLSNLGWMHLLVWLGDYHFLKTLSG